MTDREELFEKACEAVTNAMDAAHYPAVSMRVSEIVRAAVMPYVAALDEAEARVAAAEKRADANMTLLAAAGLGASEMIASHDAVIKRAESAEAECDRLRCCVEKIDAIRNSIIGTQTINWSAHIYPLVAALGEAGFEGQGYEVARARAQTLLAERDALRAKLDALVGGKRTIYVVVQNVPECDVEVLSAHVRREDAEREREAWSFIAEVELDCSIAEADASSDALAAARKETT